MVNSYNSRSPIILDTPERVSVSPNAVIEINDSAGHPRNHIRRRRLDSPDDVIVTDSPKRARVEVPVIDLTSDNDDNDYVTPGNDTERLLMSMREQVQNSTRRLAELRARRREQMMSMLPDNTRRHLRRVISRHRLNHPRYHIDNHHSNSSDDNRTESRRNQPLVNVPSEDGMRPIVVDDDDTTGSTNSFDHDGEYSRPSCSRVNPSRVYLPDNTNGSNRPSLQPSGSRGERSRIPNQGNTHIQDSSDNESDRSSFSDFRERFHSSLRGSRARQNQRRRQQLRDCLAYLSPLSRSMSNTQGQSDEHLARNIQSAEYQAGSPTFEETLPVIPDIEPHRVPRRLPSRGLSHFEQPLQPYIPDLLIPAVLSIWDPETRLRHLGEPEEEREDYEALWNLTERLGQVKPKGLTKADMEEIPAFRFSAASKDSSNGSCVVCMMDYSNKEKLRRLPCGHDFHAKCIDRWLKNNRSCPVCRKDVTSK